jgi:hypothetical protein
MSETFFNFTVSYEGEEKKGDYRGILRRGCKVVWFLWIITSKFPCILSNILVY